MNIASALSHFKLIWAFILLAFVGANLPIRTLAKVSCHSIMGGKATWSKFLTPNELLQAGLTLKARAHTIDPAKTHLEELSPVVQQIAVQTLLMLKQKKNDKAEIFYAERAPILEKMIEEITTRISSKNVTYEWSMGLILRVGYFSNMKYKVTPYDQTRVDRGAEDPSFINPHTYLTHENFMKAYKQGLEFKSSSSAKSKYVEYVKVLVEGFPGKIFVPAFMNLSLADINRMFEAKTYPVGMLRTEFNALLDGGQVFDGITFPIHDIFHVNNAIHIHRVTITAKLADLMESKSLQVADQAKGLDHDLFHLFHNLLFHEDNRFLYRRNTKTREDLHDLYTQNLDGLMGRIVNFNAESEVYSQAFLNMPRMARGEYLRLAEQRYVNALKHIIESNAELVDAELKISSP